MDVTDYALWQLVQRHKTTPAGLAIWLAWEMDATLSQLIALTWADADLPGERLRLGGEWLPLPVALCRALEAQPMRQGPLLQTRRGTAFTAPYLSRLTGELLRREGLRGVTLRTLRPYLRFDQTAEILRLSAQEGVTAAEAAKALGIPLRQAAKGLKRLLQRGRMERRGHRYFLPEGGGISQS